MGSEIKGPRFERSSEFLAGRVQFTTRLGTFGG